MTIFGFRLSRVENHICANIKKTTSAFPEEIALLEYGLDLMFKLTRNINEALKDREEPQLYANGNLFARNRQLLLNAYFCLRCSHYGTQFVILRTIMENNTLMRLFNLHPRYAYEWLPLTMQKQFSSRTQAKYGKSGKAAATFKFPWVRNMVFKKGGKEKIGERIGKIYRELCDYTHPNFRGWRELMGLQVEKEILLELPAFTPDNASELVGVTLYSMQMSFKTCVETFNEYLHGFVIDLNAFQRQFNKLMARYEE
jgi:hypothetical protein